MNSTLTPEEREKLVTDNINLAYYFVNQLQYVNPNDFDDLVQIARIGLIKAALTFNPNNGNEFSTYAGRCIQNEIRMHFRKCSKDSNNVSLNDVINHDNDGETLELQDILGTEDEVDERMLDEDMLTTSLEIILNVLNPKEAIVMLYKMSGLYTQREIGMRLKLSQSYIARIHGKAEQKIRKFLENQNKIQFSVFSLIRVGEIYKFTCNTRWLNNCLEKFLQEQKVTAVNYKFIKDKERSVLWMPRCEESFVLIAEFLRTIYEY